MAREVDRYSRLIRWLKVVLPLIALGILSTVFLVSQQGEREGSLPYPGFDLEQLAREERIGAPAYRGVAGDGTAVNVIAASARPDRSREGILLVEEVTALFEGEQGVVTHVAADRGEIDGEAGRAILRGAVRVATSTGYVMRTEELRIGLGSALIESPSAMKATGPAGEITAGRMRAKAAGAAGGEPLVFNRGVSLIYEP